MHKILILALVGLFTACSSYKTTTDYNTAIDFNTYKSYQILEGKKNMRGGNSLYDSRVKGSLKSQLAEKGINQAKYSDMLVKFDFKVKQKK